MTRTERPAWLDDADPMTPPTDTQRSALARLRGLSTPTIVDPIPRRVHQSWVHHSTRDALLRRGLITIDDSGYVTLTDTGRQAVNG